MSSPPLLVDSAAVSRHCYDRILVDALKRALVESDNYKCRIQAAVALSTSRISAFGGVVGIREALVVCQTVEVQVRVEMEDERRRTELAHLLLLEKKVRRSFYLSDNSLMVLLTRQLGCCIDRLSGLL